MKINRIEELECWQEARAIVNSVYSVCRVNGFRKDHILINQAKRSAVSIMANIAEGFSRKGNKEFIQFLFIAKASATELQSHLYIAITVLRTLSSLGLLQGPPTRGEDKYC